MLKTIVALATRLLPTKTIDRAIADLTKAASALRAAEDAHNAAAAKAGKKASFFATVEKDALAAADRAKRVGDKLVDLVA